jgi:hypothetical protein
MRIPRHSLGLTAVAFAMVVEANPSEVYAQSGLGYVTAGPALVRGFGYHDLAVQAGVGGEIGTGMVGLGGGFDYIYFTEAKKIFDNGRGSASSPAAGMPGLSLRASGYPGRAKQDRRTQPFIMGAITFLMAKEAPPLMFAGGGVDWWATRKAGLRVEVETLYFYSLVFRCGVVFR